MKKSNENKTPACVPFYAKRPEVPALKLENIKPEIEPIVSSHTLRPTAPPPTPIPQRDRYLYRMGRLFSNEDVVIQTNFKMR